MRGVQRKYLYRFICISGSWEADARRGKNCYVSVSFFHCLEIRESERIETKKKEEDMGRGEENVLYHLTNPGSMERTLKKRRLPSGGQAR